MERYDAAELNRFLNLEKMIQEKLIELRINLEEENNFCAVPEIIWQGFMDDGFVVRIERLNPSNCQITTREAITLVSREEIKNFMATCTA